MEGRRVHLPAPRVRTLHRRYRREVVLAFGSGLTLFREPPGRMGWDPRAGQRLRKRDGHGVEIVASTR